MSLSTMHRHLARWHIWLGWLAGVPLVMWTVTGLVMVARPIEEVRGEHLRKHVPELPLPAGSEIDISLPQGSDRAITAVETTMEGRAPVTRITYMDGVVQRYAENGVKMPPLSDVSARMLVADAIVGGEKVIDTKLFTAEAPPLDFRRPVDVWRVSLADGTYVYVGHETGRIEAVRTRWWRIFDMMWGLHIMDLDEREDTSHPILIATATLSFVAVLIGVILLFRRRRAVAR
ncbi:hypothetical protein G7A66_07495 [Altererythrobacter sp. SALINAS58]|uniref:PepSY domain-containing protein n=1 Tax=Alteripontixanthobacter muriae TaxID=2705546 RepID=UPI001575D5C5|nr:PepSY domain-containing protein [Alteripontixanthobacter muriae]NTZ42931.1 hypothetical protein [Alteripontixanthobacter muriae]